MPEIARIPRLKRDLSLWNDDGLGASAASAPYISPCSS